MDSPVTDLADSPVEMSRVQAYNILRNGLKRLNISLEEDAINHCLDHVQTLVKWNRVHNLSAIRSMSEILVKHLLDSFSILEYVKGKDVIDVGSGAGFPGIPVALAKPESHVVLLDSSMKKSEFLRHSVAQMSLSNVTVMCERVQKLAKARIKFDTILVRALGSLDTIADCCLPILRSNGHILAMKGSYPSHELKILRTACESSIHQLSVPGLEEKRHLVVLKRKTI